MRTDERADVVLDTAGAVELLTVDRADGEGFIREAHAGCCWSPMAERWLFACLLMADALRSVSDERRAATLAGFRDLARPPDDWADYG